MATSALKTRKCKYVTPQPAAWRATRSYAEGGKVGEPLRAEVRVGIDFSVYYVCERKGNCITCLIQARENVTFS
jgi:ferredoxin